MTDTNPSGENIAPVADNPAPATSAATPAVSFGSTRGSGLARGKRQSSAAAPSGAPIKSDYKPTSVAIITPAREYKNPFASAEPASPPAEEPANVETAAIEQAPVAQVAPASVPAPAAESAPVAESPAPAAAVEAPAEEQVVEKSEIQILPPAESARPAVSWESPSARQPEGDRPERSPRQDRPTFRPDRRADHPDYQKPEYGEQRRESFNRDGRQPRDPREPRQPRDPREARQPRDPRDYPQSEPRARTEAPAPKKQGFFGWLKGLFGAKPAETPAPSDSPADQFGEGGRHRRRHRGGRGGQGPGFRGDRFAPGGERQPGGEQDNRGGERQDGGHRRRRHRGGRGRDRGGDHRSQGAQGGGAI